MANEKTMPIDKKGRPIWVFLAVVGIAMLCMVIVLVCVVHAPWVVIVNEVVKNSIFSSFILTLFEPFYQKYHEKRTLTTTYLVGVGLFLVSTALFYAGAMVKTVLWCVIDWGIGTLFGVVGLLWYFKVFGHEVDIAHKTEQKLWKKRRKMYAEQGMTEAEIFEDAKTFLEFYTVGNSLEGDLDLDRAVGAEGYSIAEMVESNPSDALTLEAVAWLKDAVHDFCTKPRLVKESRR